jgi:uncharacterized membrane protein YgcG
MSSLSRLFRHFLMTRWRVRNIFTNRALNEIEQAISAAEKSHGGEIRFAVEGELHTVDLLRNLSPRARAGQVFAQLGVWDTEHNNGVLIYVLLADRAVEIVADRGYAGKVDAADWRHVCHVMEQAFRRGEFTQGVLDGVAAVSKLIARPFPTRDRDELPNRPAML